jgi:hypothetical protein
MRGGGRGTACNGEEGRGHPIASLHVSNGRRGKGVQRATVRRWHPIASLHVSHGRRGRGGTAYRPRKHHRFVNSTYLVYEQKHSSIN